MQMYANSDTDADVENTDAVVIRMQYQIQLQLHRPTDKVTDNNAGIIVIAWKAKLENQLMHVTENRVNSDADVCRFRYRCRRDVDRQ